MKGKGKSSTENVNDKSRRRRAIVARAGASSTAAYGHANRAPRRRRRRGRRSWCAGSPPPPCLHNRCNKPNQMRRSASADDRRSSYRPALRRKGECLIRSPLRTVHLGAVGVGCAGSPSPPSLVKLGVKVNHRRLLAAGTNACRSSRHDANCGNEVLW